MDKPLDVHDSDTHFRILKEANDILLGVSTPHRSGYDTWEERRDAYGDDPKGWDV